jgi:hypothetical protein
MPDISVTFVHPHADAGVKYPLFLGKMVALSAEFC